MRSHFEIQILRDTNVASKLNSGCIYIIKSVENAKLAQTLPY